MDPYDEGREAFNLLDALCVVLHAYKEFYEALDNWTQAQASDASNDDYLPAADRMRAARLAVKNLRGE